MATKKLEGTYTLNDPAAATKSIEDAIDAAVKDVNIFIRGIVRGKLKDKNLPPPAQITISYTQEEVTIQIESGTIQTPSDGTFVQRMVKKDKVEVSTKWKGGQLERTFRTGDGERVNLYSLKGDENTLTMQVTITSGSLPRGCTYVLRFARK